MLTMAQADGFRGKVYGATGSVGGGASRSNTAKHNLQLASEAQDDMEAAKFYNRACNGGSAEGCYIYGSMMEEGKGVPKDSWELSRVFKKAIRLYGKDCDGGDAKGCLQVAKIFLDSIEKNPKEMAIFYRKACDMGSAEGCNGLGTAFWLGGERRGVERNFYEAARFLRKACSLDYSWGCGHLGSLYHSGYGVPRDLYMAAKLYGIACNSDRSQYCRSYRNLKNRGY